MERDNLFIGVMSGTSLDGIDIALCKIDGEKIETVNAKEYPYDTSIKNDVLDATTKEFDLGLKDLNTLLDTHVEYIDIKKDLIKNSYDLFLEKCKIFNGIFDSSIFGVSKNEDKSCHF